MKICDITLGLVGFTALALASGVADAGTYGRYRHHRHSMSHASAALSRDVGLGKQTKTGGPSGGGTIGGN